MATTRKAAKGKSGTRSGGSRAREAEAGGAEKPGAIGTLGLMDENPSAVEAPPHEAASTEDADVTVAAGGTGQPDGSPATEVADDNRSSSGLGRQTPLEALMRVPSFRARVVSRLAKKLG